MIYEKKQKQKKYLFLNVKFYIQIRTITSTNFTWLFISNYAQYKHVIVLCPNTLYQLRIPIYLSLTFLPSMFLWKELLGCFREA